jgi:hypothetical protein
MKKLLIISAAAVALTASARTVYDVGKALRQNGETGTYANPNGVWSYYYASSLSPFSGTLFESTSTITSDKLAGWKNWDHQHLKVNVTGQILDAPSLVTLESVPAYWGARTVPRGSTTRCRCVT